MTKAELIGLIKGKMEPTHIRAAVINWAVTHQGKPLRKNNVPAGFYIRRQYGMTHLENEAYSKGDFHNGMSVLLAHSEKNIYIPTPDVIRERNTCYWKGADERNAQRVELLADSPRLDKLLSTINRTQRAVMETRAAEKKLKDLLQYPLFPESYDIEKIAFLKDE